MELQETLKAKPSQVLSYFCFKLSLIVHFTAQYTAASKSSTLDPTARALDTLHKSFTSDPKLPQILSAPTLTDSDKSALVSELVKTSGAPSSDKTVRNFLDTLADNNRLGVLGGVCEKFAELMSAHRGEVEMTVTSAAPLEQKVVKSLEQTVGRSQYVGQGKKLKVVTKVGFCRSLACRRPLRAGF